MAVGFGFSVSDICASLKIIKDSVVALDETKGATAEYLRLLTEIQSLQDGLEAIQDLQKSDCLSMKQRAALDRSAVECRKNIQEFFSSISKYQPHLKEGATGLQSKFRRIKWALCKKEDVAEFRERLARQASSISMLIITFQTKGNLDTSEKTIADSALVRHEPAYQSRMVEILSAMSVEHRQCFMMVMNQNKELMRTVQDMRTMMELQRSIPSQVFLQQPIVLLDPFGRLAPFHLEFVDSRECFIAVMKARFARAGVKSTGLVKLDHQEFSLENARGKRPVDLTKKWEHVWKPGEQYDMKMIFHRFTCQPSPPSTCPSCNELVEEEQGQIQCHVCGLQYQTVQAIDKKSSEWNRHFPEDAMVDIGEEGIPYLLRHPSRGAEIKVFRPSTESEEESFEGYRRVQIVSQPLTLLDQRYPALVLLEDFVRFAKFVMDLPSEVSFHQDVIMQLQRRASQYLSEQRNHLPAFSSFSQIEQRRKNRTDVIRGLQQDIDSLIRKMCEDPELKNIMAYIRPNASKNRTTDYYTGVLTKMANHSEFATTGGNKSPKSISREKMQWLLLDSKPGPKARSCESLR